MLTARSRCSVRPSFDLALGVTLNRMKSDPLTRTLVRTVLAMLLLAPAAHGEDLGQTIQVPLDYSRPLGQHAALYFELGAPFNRRKPVVIVVADGQQFYVRKGAVADLQKSIFGDRFNVVGIVGRGRTDAFVQAALNDKGEKDWSKAWTIFRSEQWIGDIERVRKALVGANGKIMLYGRSGGAYLVQQYLQKYSDHVSRAFTSSAVSPCHNRELGIPIDTYWDELAPDLQTTLLRVFQRRASERLPILVALQRQHFFVPANGYPAAREELIRSLDRGDDATLARARKEYQVDESSRWSPRRKVWHKGCACWSSCSRSARSRPTMATASTRSSNRRQRCSRRC